MMDFYLIQPNGKKIHFPVNPETVDVQTEKKIDTINLNDIGEIDITVGERRAEYRFSSFFPKYHDSYCQYENIPDPDVAIKELNKIREAGKPVRLLISGSSINSLVLITNITSTIRGGEVGDVYFDIEMRAWKEVKVRKTTRKISQPKRPRPNPKSKSKLYTVRKGDTLWDISKRYYGSGTKWRRIWNSNKSKLIKKDSRNKRDPGHWIYPGQKLVIPS
ncbi:LysM peptidoglycan-binding domain-containing protein [Virgibacillus halodenitrificans]|uniref:LysM peptidoglycan-binding domain-containing protein n=1 Tax=Virgibacillus halodenitrificans TaxID=1482 RepID=UPI001371076E|nr:LysM peptidoglycan-binding domain-containing protein [Virgibacillus halodenitrificans]MYL45059.1 LysM peptidoglycan-binding domain-containing protein [Virgibacillus halodenitrificans]